MKLIATLSLLTALAHGQTKSGSIQTKGVCSPVITGSGNTINIKTCGQEQGDEFRRLLKAIAGNQQLNTAALLKKMDECLRTMADRHLTDQQKTILVSAMKAFKGNQVELNVIASNPEAYRFAEDFVDVFKRSEFTFRAWSIGSDKTGINAIMNLSGAVPREGIVVTTKDASTWELPVFKAFAAAMEKAKVSYSKEHQANYSGDPEQLTIFVRSKPIQH